MTDNDNDTCCDVVHLGGSEVPDPVVVESPTPMQRKECYGRIEKIMRLTCECPECGRPMHTLDPRAIRSHHMGIQTLAGCPSCAATVVILPESRIIRANVGPNRHDIRAACKLGITR